MPAFKPKANKKIPNCKKSTITLDSKHNEKMEEFKKIEKKTLPILEDTKKIVLSKLNNPILYKNNKLKL